MPRCNCKICKVSRVLRRVEKKCSQSEKAALHELWNMAEDDSNTLGLLEAKASGGLPVVIAGKKYRLAMED